MASLVAQLVKNPSAMWETWAQSLGWEDRLKGKATHSSNSGLENSMDCIVHGVTKSWMWLRDFHFQRIQKKGIFICLFPPLYSSSLGAPSMEFSRQEYWSGEPFPSPGDLSNSGIKHGSPALQMDFLLSEPPGKPLYSRGNIMYKHANQLTDRLFWAYLKLIAQNY